MLFMLIGMKKYHMDQNNKFKSHFDMYVISKKKEKKIVDNNMSGLFFISTEKNFGSNFFL
jgi:hypothetical protein